MKKLNVVNNLDNTSTKFHESRESSKPYERENKNRTKQLLGLLGSVILFVGLFAPIVNITIIRRTVNMNYFQYWKDDGTIILFLAAVSLLLALLKIFKGLWFTGLICMTILVSNFINIQGSTIIQIQWGWALLIIGVVLVIASAAIKE